MFKQLLNGWRARRICTAMGAANAYVSNNDWQNAKLWLGIAEEFSKKATLHRKLLIDMILAWGLMSVALKEQGRKVASEKCLMMEQMLQARFNAGEYYADAYGVPGFYDR